MASGGAAPGVTAVVVNYNGGEDLVACLASLYGQPGLSEVVVVDNASTDGSPAAAAARFPATTVVALPDNKGFAAAVMAGVGRARQDTLLVLNPDVRLAPGCVAALHAALADRDGVAGPVLDVEATGAREHGCTINRLGMPRALDYLAPPLYVAGCALATTKRMLATVGGFDERYFLFAEDVEYCWRVLLVGGDVQVVPEARAWHRGGGVAPGGYARAGGWATSELRVALRERNTLAAMLSCAPPAHAAYAVAGCTARTLALAAAALPLRRPQLARALLDGLAWNVRQLGPTLARRRSLPRTSAGGREAARRVARGWFLLDTLRRYGVPRIDRSSAVA